MTDPLAVDRLFISIRSWHYRYFRFVRRQFGAKDAVEVTSLCPYFQTMLWGTIVLTGAIPFMLLGFLWTKFFQTIYRISHFLGLTFIVDRFEQSGFADFLEETPSEMRGEGALAALVGLGLTVLVGTISLVSVVVVALIVAMFTNVNVVAANIWHGIEYTGWGIFMGFGGVGYSMNWVKEICVWLYTNENFWSIIGWWLLLSLGFIFGAAILGMFMYVFFKGPLGRGIAAWLANGFAARREIITRELQDRKDRRAAQRFGSKSVVTTDGRAGRFLNVFGVIWEYFKAAKLKVCPKIEFIGIVKQENVSEHAEYD